MDLITLTKVFLLCKVINLLFICGAGENIQGLLYARQVFNPRAIHPSILIFSVNICGIKIFCF
jgi:hypothetical protein